MSRFVWGAAVFAAAYLIGSVPWAYVIVRRVTGEDIAAHGTGNVGAMNVRRSTGSWRWFVVAMVADASKGMLAVGATRLLPATIVAAPAVALAGAVVGHNYSLWMALLKRRFERTGKGLATGGGALLIYDWRYFVVALTVALLVIAVTKYMLAGQVAAAAALPVTALALHSPDWPFALAIGLLVYAAHHKRFVGMLQGKEPRLYIDDGKGPRG
ncbi:MAG: glycerol-3-phosphate acyltransferase [Coriobacteriia bacterium]